MEALDPTEQLRAARGGLARINAFERLGRCKRAHGRLTEERLWVIELLQETLRRGVSGGEAASGMWMYPQKPTVGRQLGQCRGICCVAHIPLASPSARVVRVLTSMGTRCAQYRQANRLLTTKHMPMRGSAHAGGPFAARARPWTTGCSNEHFIEENPVPIFFWQ